jgi:threonine/homoserine/homoserine lactone efflux protein
MDLLLRGLAIGFVIAAGFGPIGLLCVRRTLESGFAVGFATGLGAATADAAFAGVAAFGGSAIGGALTDVRRPLAIVGGIILLALGVRGWMRASRPIEPPVGRPVRALATAWATTLGLTLSNPMTVLSFAAAFAGLAPPSGDAFAAATIVTGVGLGSALWWIILSSGVSLARRSVSAPIVHGLRSGSALLLAAFGLVAIGSALLP